MGNKMEECEHCRALRTRVEFSSSVRGQRCRFIKDRRQLESVLGPANVGWFDEATRNRQQQRAITLSAVTDSPLPTPRVSQLCGNLTVGSTPDDSICSQISVDGLLSGQSFLTSQESWIKPTLGCSPGSTSGLEDVSCDSPLARSLGVNVAHSALSWTNSLATPPRDPSLHDSESDVSEAKSKDLARVLFSPGQSLDSTGDSVQPLDSTFEDDMPSSPSENTTDLLLKPDTNTDKHMANWRECFKNRRMKGKDNHEQASIVKGKDNHESTAVSKGTENLAHTLISEGIENHENMCISKNFKITSSDNSVSFPVNVKSVHVDSPAVRKDGESVDDNDDSATNVLNRVHGSKLNNVTGKDRNRPLFSKRKAEEIGPPTNNPVHISHRDASGGENRHVLFENMSLVKNNSSIEKDDHSMSAVLAPEAPVLNGNCVKNEIPAITTSPTFSQKTSRKLSQNNKVSPLIKLENWRESSVDEALADFFDPPAAAVGRRRASGKKRKSTELDMSDLDQFDIGPVKCSTPKDSNFPQSILSSKKRCKRSCKKVRFADSFKDAEKQLDEGGSFCANVESDSILKNVKTEHFVMKDSHKCNTDTETSTSESYVLDKSAEMNSENRHVSFELPNINHTQTGSGLSIKVESPIVNETADEMFSQVSPNALTEMCDVADTSKELSLHVGNIKQAQTVEDVADATPSVCTNRGPRQHQALSSGSELIPENNSMRPVDMTHPFGLTHFLYPSKNEIMSACPKKIFQYKEKNTNIKYGLVTAVSFDHIVKNKRSDAQVGVGAHKANTEKICESKKWTIDNTSEGTFVQESKRNINMTATPDRTAGYRRAGAEVIQTPTMALAKAKQLIDEDVNKHDTLTKQYYEDENKLQTSTSSKKKEIDKSEAFKKQSNMCQSFEIPTAETTGFKSASGKAIPLSEASLKSAKDILGDENLPMDKDREQHTGFKLPGQSLKSAYCKLGEDVNPKENFNNDQPANASRPMKESSPKWSQSKYITDQLKNVDPCDLLDGDLDLSEWYADMNQEEALETTLNTSDNDTNANRLDKSNCAGEITKSKGICQFQGFKTASGQAITLTDASMNKAKTMMNDTITKEDMCVDNSGDMKSLSIKLDDKIKNIKPDIIKKQTHIDQSANDIKRNVSMPKGNATAVIVETHATENTDLEDIPVGFKMASENCLKRSENSQTRANPVSMIEHSSFVDNANTKLHKQSESFMGNVDATTVTKDDVSTVNEDVGSVIMDLAAKPNTVSTFIGFSTASGQNIHIDHKQLRQVESNLFAQQDLDSACTASKQEMSDMPKFTCASGKSLNISTNAFKKAYQLMCETDAEVKADDMVPLADANMNKINTNKTETDFFFDNSNQRQQMKKMSDSVEPYSSRSKGNTLMQELESELKCDLPTETTIDDELSVLKSLKEKKLKMESGLQSKSLKGDMIRTCSSVSRHSAVQNKQQPCSSRFPVGANVPKGFRPFKAPKVLHPTVKGDTFQHINTDNTATSRQFHENSKPTGRIQASNIMLQCKVINGACPKDKNIHTNDEVMSGSIGSDVVSTKQNTSTEIAAENTDICYKKEDVSFDAYQGIMSQMFSDDMEPSQAFDHSCVKVPEENINLNNDANIFKSDTSATDIRIVGVGNALKMSSATSQNKTAYVSHSCNSFKNLTGNTVGLSTGFSSASGKSLSVSSSALAHAKSLKLDESLDNKNVLKTLSETDNIIKETPSKQNKGASEQMLETDIQLSPDLKGDNTCSKRNRSVPPEYLVGPAGDNSGKTIFCGFQTASGKKVDVTEESLSKARENWADAATDKDVLVIKDINHDVKPTKVKTSLEDTSTGLSFQPVSGNSAEGLNVEVNSDSSANVAVSMEMCIQNKMFPFQTASGQTVKVSEKSLRFVRDSHGSVNEYNEANFETADEVKTSAITSDMSNVVTDLSVSPFKTASGCNVKISENALKAARETFNDSRECTFSTGQSENAAVSVCPFKTAGGLDVHVSEDALKFAQLRNESFDDIPVESCNTNTIHHDDSSAKIQSPFKNTNSCHEHVTKTNFSVCPFKTASGIKVNVSEQALKLSRAMFENESANNTQESEKENPNHANINTEHNIGGFGGFGGFGFQTAGGTKVQISRKSVAAAKKMLDDVTDTSPIDSVCNLEVNDPNKSGLKGMITGTGASGFGFQTAGGAKVQISRKSVAASRKMLDDVADTTPIDSVYNADVNDPSKSPGQKGMVTGASGFGFQTAAGAKVEISRKSVDAARKMLDDVANTTSIDSVCNADVNDTSKSPGQKRMVTGASGFAFQTASGSKVEISTKAVSAARKIFEDADDTNKGDAIVKNLQVIKSVKSTSLSTEVKATHSSLPNFTADHVNVDQVIAAHSKTRHIITVASNGVNARKTSELQPNSVNEATAVPVHPMATGRVTQQTWQGYTGDQNLERTPTKQQPDIRDVADNDRNQKAGMKRYGPPRIPMLATPEGTITDRRTSSTRGLKPQYSRNLHRPSVRSQLADITSTLSTPGAVTPTKSTFQTPYKTTPSKVDYQTADKPPVTLGNVKVKAPIFLSKIGKTTNSDPNIEVNSRTSFNCPSRQQKPYYDSDQSSIMSDKQSSLATNSTVKKIKETSSFNGGNKKMPECRDNVQEFLKDKVRADPEKDNKLDTCRITLSNAEGQKVTGEVQPCHTEGQKVANECRCKMDNSFTEEKLHLDECSQGDDDAVFYLNLVDARQYQEEIILNKKSEKIEPICGRMFEMKQCDRRWKLKDVVQPRYGQLNKLKSTNGVHLTAKTAADFTFCLQDFYGQRMAHILVGDGAYLVPDDNGCAGKLEFYRGFVTMKGVDTKLVSESWVYNHYRWIVWKLAAYDVVSALQSRCLTPENVILQLKYRYDREIDLCHRSALKKIYERDDAPSKRMVLCVSGIRRVTSPQDGTTTTDKMCLELTDGWYSIWAVIDGPLTDAIGRGQIAIGRKLCMSGAEIIGGDDACSPLEAPDTIMLKLNYNATRPAPWDGRLGYQRDPRPLCVPLGGLSGGGGQVGVLDVVVVRRYQIMYMEKLPAGGCVFRTSRAEERVRQQFQARQQSDMERLYAQMERELEAEEKQEKGSLSKKRWTTSAVEQLQSGQDIHEAINSSLQPDRIESLLSSQQIEMLMEHRRQVHDQRQQELNSRFQSAWADRDEGVKDRNVTPVLKFRVAGCSRQDIDEQISTILTIWRPAPELCDLKEGGRYKIYNVNTGVSRSKFTGHSIQLTATKQTKFRLMEIDENFLDNLYEPREVLWVSDICRRQPPYGEVDFVGVVVRIDAATYGESGRLMDSVYVCDCQGNSLTVKFWGGYKNFSDDIHEGNVIFCSNLMDKSTYRSKQLPSVEACSEFTQITNKPQNAEQRKALERLNTSLKDKTLFLESAQSRLDNLLEHRQTHGGRNTPEFQTDSSMDDDNAARKTKTSVACRVQSDDVKEDSEISEEPCDEMENAGNDVAMLDDCNSNTHVPGSRIEDQLSERRSQRNDKQTSNAAVKPKITDEMYDSPAMELDETDNIPVRSTDAVIEHNQPSKLCRSNDEQTSCNATMKPKISNEITSDPILEVDEADNIPVKSTDVVIEHNQPSSHIQGSNVNTGTPFRSHASAATLDRPTPSQQQGSSSTTPVANIQRSRSVYKNRMSRLLSYGSPGCLSPLSSPMPRSVNKGFKPPAFNKK